MQAAPQPIQKEMPMPFPPHSPPAPDFAASALPLRGVTLLLVEDSRFTCDALRLIVTRAGARLRRADTLAAARSHLGCYRPDLMIVDLGLPDGRGEALIAEGAALGLPVLGISGDPDGRLPALEAGAIAFVDKPIGSIAGLMRLIRQLVSGAGALPAGEEMAPPKADPMALRDDLAHAARLIGETDPDGYATGFVRSLARTVGDIALEDAALKAGDPPGRQALAALLAQRLTEVPTLA
jgi:DNA-binding response OmpR family regulator